MFKIYLREKKKVLNVYLLQEKFIAKEILREKLSFYASISSLIMETKLFCSQKSLFFDRKEILNKVNQIPVFIMVWISFSLQSEGKQTPIR
jgi:hypothetical protein